MIGEQGVIFGPGKVNEYVKKLNPKSSDCQSIVPPTNLGKTITSLFEKGVIYEPEKRNSNNKSPIFVRGWSLSEFWEHSSWPRDSSGMNIRYGLPVIEDDDDDDEDMISAPPVRSKQAVSSKAKLEEYEQLKLERESQPSNPYVKDVIGVLGVEEDIINSKQTSVLFLSAKWCKTCKKLNPQYTRLARETPSNNGLIFAKAETSGLVGKELGKYLEVDAVPAFVLFKNGKLFGTPLSVSRIPSTKLQRAIDLLSDDKEWDPTILMTQDEAGDDGDDDGDNVEEE